MKAIDHLSVGVNDIERACGFYDPVLATIGCKRLATAEGMAAYGHDRVEFLAMLPFDGEVSMPGNGVHICFAASSRAEVDRFHHTAIAEGGTDEGDPGVRTAYPMPDVYAAYVRDPFGNKLEIIHQGFSA